MESVLRNEPRLAELPAVEPSALTRLLKLCWSDASELDVLDVLEVLDVLDVPAVLAEPSGD